MVSALSAKLRTQCLDGAMPVDSERSGRASGRNRRFGERVSSKGNLFDGVALPGRKPGQGRNETSGLVHPEGRFFRVAAGVGVIFIGERLINLTRAGTARPTQSVDGAPLGNHPEPGRERAARIVGLPRA